MDKNVKNSLNVLVVDDSVTIRAMMVRVLQEDRDIVATAARSAEEADEILKDQRVDVITLDVEMPGTGGLEYLERLKRCHEIPVVMLSASTGAGAAARIKALLAGAAGCFDKADAVRMAPALIRLVKDAAGNRLRIGRSDRKAMIAPLPAS